MTFHADWYDPNNFTTYVTPRKVKVGNKEIILIDAIGEGDIDVEVFKQVDRGYT